LSKISNFYNQKVDPPKQKEEIMAQVRKIDRMQDWNHTATYGSSSRPKAQRTTLAQLWRVFPLSTQPLKH